MALVHVNGTSIFYSVHRFSWDKQGHRNTVRIDVLGIEDEGGSLPTLKTEDGAYAQDGSPFDEGSMMDELVLT